ncbi:hypothetical protein SARC_09649 [Sphaeroforma arctica JP610]|uniref:Cyclin N-terminal domain-containing protein n=1 Tax=Sphaeroforma arctica JP610 TaxID=667725 RepID=A0A0L0FMB8_9EUKA|nr:hypothetical protein SARC_09649 [Sphaeroforma arctica JP610]KNC77900.1 hypothetical protein SARC_09649 [Sphaeroforma arctica JP610]|eukprot:XP_014151802.1 hypothetical protein SARC_09649 [Sphaeroforma arctica JP610]
MPKHSSEVPTGRTLLLSINISNREEKQRQRRHTTHSVALSHTQLAAHTTHSRDAAKKLRNSNSRDPFAHKDSVVDGRQRAMDRASDSGTATTATYGAPDDATVYRVDGGVARSSNIGVELHNNAATQVTVHRIDSEDENAKSESLLVKRSNSCSTVYVYETISCPDLKRTLKYVAFALHSACLRSSGHNELYLHQAFDERYGPMLKQSRRPAITDTPPSASSVYKFLCRIFLQTSLSAEIVIVATVYVERLVFKTGIDLHATNWRRIVLGAVILASKVWDDEAVWNVDFISLFPNMNSADVNELERTFLELIEYNVGVKVSVFAKYYFDLRDMTYSTDTLTEKKPLTWRSAKRMEAVTKQTERLLVIDGSHQQLAKLKRVNSLQAIATRRVVVLS